MTKCAEYKALAVHATCYFAPSQWDVAALPTPLYVRYRWGMLTVHEMHGSDIGPELLRVNHGGAFDSEMGTHEMQQLTAELIDWSRLR